MTATRGTRSTQRGARTTQRPAHGEPTPFFKLTGSGNDFVFIDARGRTIPMPPERIQALCARGTGIGADGVVLLDADAAADLRIRYFNSDGSRAALCGNATLCTIRVAQALGIGRPGAPLRVATDSGVVTGRLVRGTPEFDVGAVDRVTTDVGIARAAGERRMGYAVVGVPHLVLWVDDVAAIDVSGRGGVLRHDAWTGPPGANVNFVATDARGGWAMRTYERGVEGETLACGTGAVATATLLSAWGCCAAGPEARLWTRSGQPVDVTVRRRGSGWEAALRGEGRLVFLGQLLDG